VHFGRPSCPQDNAAHEQMHGVLQRATARPPAYTLHAQQRRFDRWRWRYNHRRPHRGLRLRLPCELYRPGAPRPPAQKWHYPASWLRLHPDAKGRVRWRKLPRLLGQAFAGHQLGFKPLGPNHGAVYFGPHLLGTLHATDRSGLRPVRWR